MKYTVLVVEDERDQRSALIERVDWESAGFEVVGEAENGFEALEQNGILPDDASPDGIHMEPKYCHMLTDYMLAHTVEK